ncbi:hypothetical protein PI125_g18081 [Phytophthora idaei]|nr:hypothetical protein PI125_g18081 [Phytophthora idaei]
MRMSDDGYGDAECATGQTAGKQDAASKRLEAAPAGAFYGEGCI